jgi:hypothetical protein
VITQAPLVRVLAERDAGEPRFEPMPAPDADPDDPPGHAWPITTGVIGGACRHLVKDRIHITGARWGLAGAEAVLKLRTLISNGHFEEYWDYPVQREHLRFHAVRYRETLALAA